MTISNLTVKIIFPEGNLMEHTDVLVVGGGVIGVAFAASLESTGLLVTVIDQGSKPKLNSVGIVNSNFFRA